MNADIILSVFLVQSGGIQIILINLIGVVIAVYDVAIDNKNNILIVDKRGVVLIF